MRGRSLALFVGIIAIALSTAAAQSSRFVITNRGASVVRAQQWAAAVNAHVAGADDEAARTMAAWSPANLADLEVEATAIATLIRNRRAQVFLLPVPGERVVPRQILYAPDERDVLQEIATTGGERFLARAVLLHTDIAMGLVTAGSVAPDTRGSAAVVSFADGTTLGIRRSGDHWQTARVLVDLLRRRAEMEPLARDWYRATMAVTQLHEQWNIVLTNAAVQRFPDDADVLFLAGAFHEAMAAPQVQRLVRTFPGDVEVGVRSPGDERRVAIDLLRRAVSRQPEFAEARIHLGRMLALDGKDADAARELTRAAAAVTDPVLAYYASLFLGEVREVTRQPGEAIDSYRRAAALFPSAQSPKLAIGAMLAGGGDQQAALAAVQLPADRSESVDPWWSYYRHPGRSGTAWLADVTSRLQQVGPPSP